MVVFKNKMCYPNFRQKIIKAGEIMSIVTTPTENIYGTVINGRVMRPRRPRIGESPRRNIEEDIVAPFDTFKEKELARLEETVRLVEGYKYGDTQGLEFIRRMASLNLGFEISEGFMKKVPYFTEEEARQALGGRLKEIKDRGIKAKSKLEVRKLLNDINKPEGEKAVQTYLQEKSSKDRFEIAKELLRYFKEPLNPQNLDFQGCDNDYKQKVADGRMQACNKVLRTLGYEVVKVDNIKTPTEIQQVVRAAFDGRLNLPTHEDTVAGNGYSKNYNFFANPDHDVFGPRDLSSFTPLPADYDFAATELGKAMALSDDMKIMIPDIQKAVRNARLPLEVAENLSLSDVAHLMIKEKRIERQDHIKFKQINPKCSVGAREKFWEDFGKNNEKMTMLRDALLEEGVDKEYIKDLLCNLRLTGQPVPERGKEYNQPIPEISIHHDFYIQDAAAQKNPLMVDNAANFGICIDFPSLGINTHKQNGKENGFKHMADTMSIDGNSAYRLVTYPDESGRGTLISVGTKQISAEMPDKENLLTYAQMAERKSYQ